MRPPLEIAGIRLTPRVLRAAYKRARKKADYWSNQASKLGVEDFMEARDIQFRYSYLMLKIAKRLEGETE